MDAKEILKTADAEGVHFMRLEFTDILGVLKNVEIPRSQFEKALDGQIMFDGSSIEGFTRIEESDMLLAPDLDTFRINPWKSPDGSRVGRLICDVQLPDGTPFPGCPRTALQRQVERAAEMGYTMVAGPEGQPAVFDVATGEAVTSLKGHESASWSIRFSPDGTKVATSTERGRARVFDANCAQCHALGGEAKRCPPLGDIGQLVQRAGVYARERNEAEEPEDDQRTDGEPDTVLQLGGFREIGEAEIAREIVGA